MLSRTLLLTLIPSALAHFQVTWPPSRGFSEDKIINGPCGGFDTVGTRTPFSLVGQTPIQLNMEHTEVKGLVTLALGNDPGNNYNIILKPVFQENGPDDFCIGGVTIPSNLNITAGSNGTIQVVTNGDPTGGLYACIDVTFTDTPLSTADYDSHCKNSTGVSASFSGGALPNGTASGTTTTSTKSSGSTASTATSSGLAAKQTLAGWALGAMGVIGGLAVL